MAWKIIIIKTLNPILRAYPNKILRDIQLLSSLEMYLMVFCLYSGLVASGRRYYPKNMVLVLPIIVGFSNGLR
jgi:hypothetical protein